MATIGVTGQARELRFRQLYDAHRARLLRYALNRTSSAEDAAEVLAETFSITWGHLDQVPEGEASLPWLYATARGVLANQGRRQRRRSELVARIGEELRGLATSAGAGEVHEDALVALATLAALSDDDRELLMLVAWDGLGPAQLGAALGCSPAAASIRLHRARARLRQKLAAAGLTSGPAQRSCPTITKEDGPYGRNATVAEP
jgi:RNA polymerase sigma-70 factor (ECF subfamily)